MRRSFHNQKVYKSKGVINQGAKNTIQTIHNALGSDKLFNGGSPILFNVVKPAIIRAFKTENVAQHIEYVPGTAPEAIEEDTFQLPEPTVAEVIDTPMANNIVRLNQLLADIIAAINASGLPPAQVNVRLLDANNQHRRDLEAVESSRPTFEAIFQRRHDHWVQEQEKFVQKQTALMKVFTRVFGATTLSTIKNYLDANRFRRAWFEICNQNAIGAQGQHNTSLLFNELSNLQFNAATTSFTALEADIRLLQEQLVELGEPVPTDASKLNQLMKALKTSPGNEFAQEIRNVEMFNLPYQQARDFFMRRASEIASEKTLESVHHTPDTTAKGLLTVVTTDKSAKGKHCTNCGRDGHVRQDCFKLQTCTNCGRKGHIGRHCRAAGKSTSGRYNGDSLSTPNSSLSVGSKFSSSKNSSVYCGNLGLTTLGTANTTATLKVTDHHLSNIAAQLQLILLTTTTTKPARIILDSGASTHMLPEEMLVNYRKSDGQVKLGDTNIKLSIMGMGDTIQSNINNVLHVQGLLIGVLAVSRFDQIQFRTEFVNGQGSVYDNEGNLFLRSTLHSDGIYQLNPEYVKCLCNRRTPACTIRVQHPQPSTSVYDYTDGDSLNNLVKPSQRVSYPSGMTSETTSTNNTPVAEAPREHIPENTSSSMLEDATTMPVSDGEHRHSPTTSAAALDGRTLPTGTTSTNDRTTNVSNNNTNDIFVYVISTHPGLNPLEILHRQWGHLGPDRIKATLQHGHVTGCPYTYEDVKDLQMGVCKECLQGRMRARREAKTTDHPWGPLEKIAIDYKGDFARKAIGGYKGFMLLVDYATNWVHADLVLSKSEHTRVLQDYKVKFVNRYGRVWKVLQSDSESIFKSKRVGQWLRKNEIRLQLSTPYQHWQNGQVEVYVRIVMDKSRTLMTAYITPVRYWGHAVKYACHILNRTPNSNTNISAFEALTGEKPDMSKAVPFYAPGVYHLTNDERKDPWSPKARPCRMLGYSEDHKDAYIILNVDTGRIIVRENCVFNIAEAVKDVEEIEINLGPERDDIGEYEIMIDSNDSDNQASDNSDVEVGDIQGEEEIDYGGENPYWFHILHRNSTTSLPNNNYNEWHNAILLSAELVQPLPPNPTSVDSALSSVHGDQWRAAITKELDQFRLRTTFGPAEQSGQGMKTKLILYYKYDGEYNLVCKARLVVCGYSQRRGIDYFDTYSPTTTTTTVFILLSLAGHLNCHVCVFDVSAAFLEGRADTKMYAWLPCDIDHEGVSRRIEILGNWYGSKQAGKIWNDLFDKIMVLMRFERNIDDPCLYKWCIGDEYIYLTVHVDDGLMLSSSRRLAQEFMTTFLTHVRKAVIYDGAKLYLAMDLTRSKDGRMFSVSQKRYIEKNFNTSTKVYRTPMSVTTNLRIAQPNNANEPLLPLTGILRYVADRTRPDILVALGEISTGGAESPSDEHYRAAERIKHYLNGSKDLVLQLGGSSPIILFGYCDAAYVTTGNCKSRLGSCLFVNKDSGSISTVSRNDTTVSHSSTESEIKALDMICREIIVIRSMLDYLGMEQTEPTKVYIDNRSAIELCRLLKVHNRIRHINVRINYIRELINARVIELMFVPSKDNVADVLTKPLPREDHVRHTTVLLQGHSQATNGISLFTTVQGYTHEYYNNIIDNEDATN